jgi:hypothetical protein
VIYFIEQTKSQNILKMNDEEAEEEWNDYFELYKGLFDFGLFWISDEKRISILHECIERPFFVRKLIELGADPNLKAKPSGNSPLVWAISRNNTDSVRVLLELGADVNIENIDGYTPLNYACNEGSESTEIVMILLKHGARLGLLEYPEESENNFDWNKARLVHHVEVIKTMVATGKIPVDLLRCLRFMLY